MATDSTDGPAAATSDGVQVISDTSAITATSDSAGTASGGSDRRIDGAEGDDNATQLTQASAIALMPKAGEWIVIRVEAGDRIEFPFSLAGAEGVLKDGNVELRLPNGGVVVLQGYLAAIEGEPPLQLTDANGDVVDLEDFIVAIDELEELGLLPPEAGLETQEQGAQQQTNPVHDGGANFAPADPIAILDGLQEAGALLGTALAFELESQDDREGGFEEDRGPTDLIWSIVGDSTVTEGTTGAYTVSYTGAALSPGQTATIAVATGGGFDTTINDAGSGADFQPVSTVLTFTGGGTTSQTLSVTIFSDTILEGSEDYTVTIASPTAGTVATSQANTVITDDDNATVPVWSVAGSSVVGEGDGPALYTVSYTGAVLAPGQTLTIAVASSGGFDSNLPNATSGADFTALSTVLTFTGGGTTSQTVSVGIVDDTIVESDEDYTVTIGGVSHGSVGTSQSNVSIIDDDGTSLVWNVTGNVSVAEGSSTTYTVSYTGAALAPGAVATIVVASADAPGGFPNATPGNDYTALPSTTLTFTGGGATQQTVVVSTMQDTLVENIEDYAVVLGNQSVGGFGTSQATTNIIDNDGTSLSWNLTGSATVTEGGAPGQYTVSYTGATLAPGVVATITVATGLTPATTPPDATPNVDYTSLTTVLTFTGGGATQQIVQVSTINDSFVEPTEDYRVTISGQSVGNISDGVEVTNIAANDTDLPRWSINGSTAIGEGGSGIYTVTYTNAAIAPGQTATITVNTANSTLTFPNATAGSDYTALTTVLTFTAGTGTSRTVSVSALVDTNLEGTEDFQVTIGGQSHGQVVAANNHVDSVIVDVSGDFRVNEVSIGALVTAPGGVATSHWIELRNTAGNAQLTTSINVEILGATGGVKTVVLPGLSVPAGGFIVLYEQGTEARYGVYDAAGVLQSSGAIAGGGSWNFGTNTAQRVGVNIVASGASTDLFIANGATPGSFTGAPTWTSPGLSGGGYAAAAGLFGGSFALLVEQASYNGQVDNQTTILQRLGLRATPPVTEANNDVFLRVDTTDGNNGTDWTTANASGDTAGALNNASYANPNDSTETITHNQTTTPAGEGQDILHAAVGGGATINGNNDNDFLYGNAGIDTLVGGSGDDFLFGHSGNDRLFGGPGSDLLVDVSGTLAANAGEYMEGGTGHDILLGTYGASANTAFMLLVGDVSLATAPNNGTDWIAGGNNADTILGDGINFAAFSQAIFLANPLAAGQPLTAYQNRVGSGSDTLLGFGGNDRIGGSGGLDSILGGTGEDTIDGDSDGDVLQGEDGSDSINGGGGSDQIWGDESDGGGTGDDTLWGESGSDLLVGGGGSDYAQGNSGNDFLEGDFGDDTLHGGMNDDTLVGGPGIDLYGLDEAAGGVLFNFADASPAPGGWQVMNLGAYGLGTDWFREMEGVAAGAGDDTIVDGIGGGQYYQGNGGNDSYTDGEGQDTYDMGGGPGDHDTLSFGSITLTAVPNVVIGFGTFFDATPPDTGDQDYIDIDAIFDAFGVSDANRTNPAFVRIFDPGPGPAPVELQVDVDGPGVGTFVTLMIFQGITSGGSLSIGNSASDDIQVGSL